jgi:hypothetical protein
VPFSVGRRIAEIEMGLGATEAVAMLNASASSSTPRVAKVRSFGREKMHKAKLLVVKYDDETHFCDGSCCFDIFNKDKAVGLSTHQTSPSNSMFEAASQANFYRDSSAEPCSLAGPLEKPLKNACNCSFAKPICA